MKQYLSIGIFLLCFSSLLFSCSSNDIKDEDDILPPEPSETIVDLSQDGLANCYIVTSPGKYKFKADNQFNLGEGLPIPPSISPVSAKLIWQTSKESIKSVKLESEEEVPYVFIELEKAYGNALVAVLDENENILWSWHIWMPQAEIKGLESEAGYIVMNMNLGAMNPNPGDPEAYGMLYQWGRKDPFPASESLTGNTSTLSAPMYDINGEEVFISYSSWTDNNNNNLEFSISNPTVCISNYSQYFTSRDWLKEENSALWGNPYGDEKDKDTNQYIYSGRKTCYDPSPLGWRVAPPDTFLKFTSSGGYAWDFNDFNVADVNYDGVINIDDYCYGWVFNLGRNESSYFPAASRFDGSYAMLMGSMSGLWGNYWSNSPFSGMPGGAICALAFQVKDQNGNEIVTVSPSAAASKADAYSVRCIKDE